MEPENSPESPTPNSQKPRLPARKQKRSALSVPVEASSMSSATEQPPPEKTIPIPATIDDPQAQETPAGPAKKEGEKSFGAWLIRQIIIVLIVFCVGGAIEKVLETLAHLHNKDSITHFREFDKKVHDDVVGIQAQRLAPIFYNQLRAEFTQRSHSLLFETPEGIYQQHGCTPAMARRIVSPPQVATVTPPSVPSPETLSVQSDPLSLYKKLHASGTVGFFKSEESPDYAPAPSGFKESQASLDSEKSLDKKILHPISTDGYFYTWQVLNQAPVVSVESANCQAADAELAQCTSTTPNGGAMLTYLGMSLPGTILSTAKQVWKLGTISVVISLISVLTATMLILSIPVKGETSGCMSAYMALLLRVLVIPIVAGLIAYLIALPMWLGAHLLHSFVNAPMTVGLFSGLSSPVALFLSGLTGKVTEHHTSHFFISKAERGLERLMRRGGK